MANVPSHAYRTFTFGDGHGRARVEPGVAFGFSLQRAAKAMAFPSTNFNLCQIYDYMIQSFRDRSYDYKSNKLPDIMGAMKGVPGHGVGARPAPTVQAKGGLQDLV